MAKKPPQQPAEGLDRARLRALAKEVAQGQTKDILELSEADVRELIHELGVSQVELETQNEELRQVQLELQQARDGYAELYDLAPAGYFTLDERGVIEAANLTGCELLGSPRSELVRRPFSGFLTEESADTFHRHLRTVFREGGRQVCELALESTEAGERYVQLESRAMPGRRKEPRSLNIVTDITERRIAEKQQALLASIVEASGDAIFAITLDGRITSWNRGAERTFGYSAAEAIGRPLPALFPPDAAGAGARILEKLRAGETIAEEETVCLRRDGRRIPVEFSLSPIHDTGGLVLAGSLIARDITLRQQAREALRRAIEVAEEADRAKGEFLTNVSHEVRTPMTVVLSALEQVLNSELNAEQKKFLQMALSSSEALLRMIDEILVVSRIDAGKLVLAREPFDLPQSVREAVDPFSLPARRKGLELSCEIDPLVPQTIVGDRDRLRQVLVNLVANAVKFTERGKVTVAVKPTATSAAEAEETVLTFSVADTGIGIPRKKMPLLFKRFTQVDATSSRPSGGIGLGLAICKELAEAMGGGMHVESEEGKGSHFTFMLPLATRGPELHIQGREGAEKAAAKAGTESRRILLVEDDPTICEVMIALLRKRGWEAVAAKDGLMALQLWGNGGFDLILMDIQMPLLDGIQVTRAIRVKEQKRGGHIPIIALTAHATREDREECLQAGMDGFLTKPAASADLYALIEEQLARQGEGAD
jgi:PAS domain S-box-containing protein